MNSASASARNELSTTLKSAFADLYKEKKDQADVSRLEKSFNAFLERGLDAVLRPSTAQVDLNATITAEDLILLDDALQNVAAQRKRFPPKIHARLEKELMHRFDALDAIRVEDCAKDEGENDKGVNFEGDVDQDESKFLLDAVNVAKRLQTLVEAAEILDGAEKANSSAV